MGGELARRVFEFGVQFGVASDLNELLLLALENLRSICLMEEKEACALDGDGRDTGRVKDPSPVALLRDKATCNGTDGWTEHRHE